jgi:fucose permease
MVVSGIQDIIQNWLPNYAVQSNIAGKQLGAHLVTLLCVCLTAFRFIFGLLRETDSFKIVLSNCGQLLSGMACAIFAINHYYSLSAYISSILYGTTLTMIFPLLLSIPHEFGLRFTDRQISNMMVLMTISNGVSAFTGELMKIDLNAYQYSLFGWSILLFGIVAVVMRMVGEEQVEGD